MELLKLPEKRGISSPTRTEQPLSFLSSTLGCSKQVEPQIETFTQVEHRVKVARSEDEVCCGSYEGEGQEHEVLQPVEPKLHLQDQQVSNECVARRNGRSTHWYPQR
jgi:hypothetical protein